MREAAVIIYGQTVVHHVWQLCLCKYSFRSWSVATNADNLKILVHKLAYEDIGSQKLLSGETIVCRNSSTGFLRDSELSSCCGLYRTYHSLVQSVSNKSAAKSRSTKSSKRALGAAHVKAPPREMTMSKLMELPPEIRNMIYELAVVLKPTKGSYGVQSLLIPASVGTPALARTSCQTRKEVLEIYYRCNRFSFIVSMMHFHTFKTWLNSIGLVYSKLIRYIHMYIADYGWTNASYFLQMKEELLSPDVKIYFLLKSNSLQYAWESAVKIGSELRTAGVSWELIERTLSLSKIIMKNIGSDGDWRDDSGYDRDSDYDSDYSGDYDCKYGGYYDVDYDTTAKF